MVDKRVPVPLERLDDFVSRPLVVVDRVLEVPLEEDGEEPHVRRVRLDEGGVVRQDEVLLGRPRVRVRPPRVPDVHVELRPGHVPAPVVPDLVDRAVVPVRVPRIHAAPAPEAVVRVRRVLGRARAGGPVRLVPAIRVVGLVGGEEVVAVRVLERGLIVVEAVGVRPGVLAVVDPFAAEDLRVDRVLVDVEDLPRVDGVLFREVEDVPRVRRVRRVGEPDVGFEGLVERRPESARAGGVDAGVERVDRDPGHGARRVPRLSRGEGPGQPRQPRPVEIVPLPVADRVGVAVVREAGRPSRFRPDAAEARPEDGGRVGPRARRAVRERDAVGDRAPGRRVEDAVVRGVEVVADAAGEA